MAYIHGYEVPFQAANEPDEERRNPGEPPPEISAQCRRGDHLVCLEPISCDCDCHDENEGHSSVSCSYPGCDRLTTFDPVYGDLCYEHVRADNE